MARRSARPQPDQTLDLPALTRICPACGGPLWAAYKTQRSVTTIEGTVRLRLQVRRCRDPLCHRRAVPLRAGGALRPPGARVRPRRHRPGRHPAACPAPQHPRDPCRVDPPRRAPLPAYRRQPAGPLRRVARPLACRHRRLRRVTAAAGPSSGDTILNFSELGMVSPELLELLKRLRAYSRGSFPSQTGDISDGPVSLPWPTR